MKFFVYVVDHDKIDWSRIRFNVNAPEEWDYVNIDFDLETHT